jgi:hypothetical protein
VVAPGSTHYPRDPADTQEWYIEQALDVEWTHAVAPRAHILYVGAANYGKGARPGPERGGRQAPRERRLQQLGHARERRSKGEVRALNSVFQQAQAQGMGIFFASGDDGDNREAFGSVSGRVPRLEPARDLGRRHQPGGRLQWAAPVGDGLGHDRDELGARRLGRAVPGYFLYGAGGGASAIYAKPHTRTGSCPARSAPSPTCRSSPTRRPGVLFTQTYSKPNGSTEQKESWIGGTSLSAPLMAGIATLANEAQRPAARFLNPQLTGWPAARPSTTSRPAAAPWPCCATG